MKQMAKYCGTIFVPAWQSRSANFAQFSLQSKPPERGAVLRPAASPPAMPCLIWRSFWMSLRITSLRPQPHHLYVNGSGNNSRLKAHCISSNGPSPARSVTQGSRRACSDPRERATPPDGFTPPVLGSSTLQEIVTSQRHNIDIAKRTVYIPVKKAASKPLRPTE